MAVLFYTRGYLWLYDDARLVLRGRGRWQAFAMGLEERLGAGSRVRWLDPGLVTMILSFTGKIPGAP